MARLRETGAVLLGKTTTPEFGWKGVTDSPRYGPTGNPWDPALTAGGSSGGSAAAVGLGMGAWSVGTDGGGSLRIPAAFTGTVTIKPTYGLVPVWPASPFGTLSHAGPITRGVADAALMLDILTGFDPRDWSALPTPTDVVPGRARRRRARAAHRVLAGPGLRAQRPAGRGGGAGRGRGAGRCRRARRAGRPGFADPVDAFHALWFAGAAKVVAGLRRRRAAAASIPGCGAAVERGRGVQHRRTIWTRSRYGWTSASGWAASTAPTTCCSRRPCRSPRSRRAADVPPDGIRPTGPAGRRTRTRST